MLSNNKNLIMILGNQLFPISHLKKINCNNVFMSEDLELCTYFKHHKLKIFLFLKAMREYRDELIRNGFNVHYTSIDDEDFNRPYIDKISNFFKLKNFKNLFYFQIEDHFFENKIKTLKNKINLIELDSPMFLNSRAYFEDFANDKNFIKMANFYKKTRKELKILVESDDKPVGGKWSFDEENRKRLPNNFKIPSNLKFQENTEENKNLKLAILNKFNDHPGNLDNVWFPTNRENALKLVDFFIEEKFKFFGHYEDAINSKDAFLFHSCLSSSLNLGIITVKEILDKVATLKNIPINSYEGFIRQIIGWREFIRGVYHSRGEIQRKSNFWNHKRKLKNIWYEGNTGIVPLDDSIKNCINYGYTHHIPRLMIISNIMNLCKVDPDDIYKWFMEMFIDSSDWVMTPNVYGMGTYADGGIFSTKPYLCGSNYILKMSDYKKGEWCEILDGLYWMFINDNKKFFSKNPRMNIMLKSLSKMEPERKKLIFKKAKKFIEKVSY